MNRYSIRLRDPGIDREVDEEYYPFGSLIEDHWKYLKVGCIHTRV